MKTYPESRLTDLLIEFDEMGFCPTTVCPNPEQTAIEWKEQIVKEIQKLQAENADLHEKLKETEHCAEVAERALLLMARGECTFAPPEFYKEEAEQEVAEEEQIMANRCGEGKCEYFEGIRRAANNNRENGYCKKYKQALSLYDWWWLKCDECAAEKEIAKEG